MGSCQSISLDTSPMVHWVLVLVQVLLVIVRKTWLFWPCAGHLRRLRVPRSLIRISSTIKHCPYCRVVVVRGITIVGSTPDQLSRSRTDAGKFRLPMGLQPIVERMSAKSGMTFKRNVSTLGGTSVDTPRRMTNDILTWKDTLVAAE